MEACGQEASADRTHCHCVAGSYDAWQPPLMGALNISLSLRRPAALYHVFCWKGSRVGGAAGYENDGLNEASAADLRLIGGADEKRCVACPACVTCERGRVSIKPRFSHPHPGHRTAAAAHVEDIYWCPLERDEEPPVCLGSAGGGGGGGGANASGTPRGGARPAGEIYAGGRAGSRGCSYKF